MKRSLKTKLKIRFVLFAMLGLLCIQTALVMTNIYRNYQDLVAKSDMLISQLHNNPSGASRYFSVKIPVGKDTIYPDAVQHISINAETATELARRALAENRDSGFLDSYRYHIYRNESGTRIYFLHRESSIEMCKLAAKNMIIISILGLVGVGILLALVSGWVVKPLVDNQQKQKQFITSASHQLKTPLSVISTNAQLLESEIGQSDWLDSIQKQVAHMTKMTHALVALSKAEEYANPLVRESFSFSESLREIADTYAAMVKDKSIQLTRDIRDPIVYSGSKAELQQLMQILLDNACKYCPEGGTICITARKRFRGVYFSIVNTSNSLGIKEGQIPVQRFRRGQNAANTAGFGLGLSIAEAISSRHNGHLTASATAEEFRVEVMLHE